jgi:hypothetical protein
MDNIVINILILLGLILFPVLSKALFKKKTNSEQIRESTGKTVEGAISKAKNNTLEEFLESFLDVEPQTNIKPEKTTINETRKNMEDLYYENIDPEVKKMEKEIFTYEKQSEEAFALQKKKSENEQKRNHQEEYFGVNIFLEEFDPRLAFVYSQILDTPRFKQM